MYLGSLLLSVQFVGDFGVMPDEAVKKPPSTLTHSHALRGLTLKIAADESATGLADMLDVPVGDVSLLLAPPSGGYGSRLHNLKIDLKEV
jgi:hypothetical protein